MSGALRRSYLSRCQPGYPEQARAVEELFHGEFRLGAGEIEGIAAEAHRALRSYVAAGCAGPAFLAAAHGIAVVLDPALPEFARYDRGRRVIFHRPHRDATRVGCALYHECAEALAPADATHPDIQLLGIALAVAPDVARRAVRETAKPALAVRRLSRYERHTPRWTLWVRVATAEEARMEEEAMVSCGGTRW